MPISSINSSNNPLEIFQQKRSPYSVQDSGGNGSRSDSVSFSEEALRLAQERNSQAEQAAKSEEESSTFRQRLDTAQEAAPPKKTSKFNLMSMLMESLFLAELDESAPKAAQGPDGMPEQATQAKSVKPLQDGAKVADLKKVISDFVSGKADVSDLPGAMAAASSGGKAGGVSGGGRNTSAVSQHDRKNII